MYMKKILFRIIHFLFHFLTAIRNYKGFGVQSPYAFSLLNDVIRAKLPYYQFSELRQFRVNLSKEKTVLACVEYGACKPNQKKKTVSSVLLSSVKPLRQQELLFRLVQFVRPKQILEIGTSLGLTTAYLAMGDSGAHVTTIDGCAACVNRAKNLHKSLNISNINVHTGEFDDVLPSVLNELQSVDFIFIDGNHKGEALLRYFDWCAPYTTKGAVVVVDDIYWSKDMNKAWQRLKNHSSVTISFDLFHFGILVLNSDATRGNYKALIL